MTQSMGWHPDPEGVPGRERWWDGKQWTSATRNVTAPPPPPPPPAKSSNRGCAIAVIVVVAVILLIGGISSALSGDDDSDSGGGSAPTGQTKRPAQPTQTRATDDFAIDVCHDAVKLKLKDPDSASFRNEKVVSSTSATWAIVGEVNANNSYGGKVGFTPFTCDATQTGDTVNARATLLE